MKILDFKIGYYNFQFLIQYVKCLEAMTRPHSDSDNLIVNSSSDPLDN